MKNGILSVLEYLPNQQNAKQLVLLCIRYILLLAVCYKEISLCIAYDFFSLQHVILVCLPGLFKNVVLHFCVNFYLSISSQKDFVLPACYQSRIWIVQLLHCKTADTTF